MPEVGLTIDKVASKLNASRRTLQLRLTDRGTNFLKILLEVRSCAAIRYLSDNRLVISEIAFFLGYSNQRSFSNTFKNWHGISSHNLTLISFTYNSLKSIICGVTD